MKLDIGSPIFLIHLSAGLRNRLWTHNQPHLDYRNWTPRVIMQNNIFNCLAGRLKELS